MAGVRRTGIEYRSEQAWGDLPILHISIGGRQADGRSRLGRARGIIALGDVATGLVAVGGVAIGLLSVGGVALGLVAVGAVAVGLAAVGAVSIGLMAVGVVAVGLTAMGMATAGLVAGPRPAAERRLGGNRQARTEAQPSSGRPVRTGPSMEELPKV
jgi:hypothetical protein